MKLAKPYKGLRGSADLYAGYEIDEERESIAQELELEIKGLREKIKWLQEKRRNATGLGIIIHTLEMHIERLEELVRVLRGGKE